MKTKLYIIITVAIAAFLVGCQTTERRSISGDIPWDRVSKIEFSNELQ
jgi:hypothetical protein